MASTIAIITLSLIVAFLCWKLIPLMIELGKYRQLEKTHINPDIEILAQQNKQLLFDIENILAGDEYVIKYCKDKIQRKKDWEKSFKKCI